MTKVEQMALEAYPVDIVKCYVLGRTFLIDRNLGARTLYTIAIERDGEQKEDKK